jgi:hypothetical protein
MTEGVNKTFTVAAKDTESDAITYVAYFLQLGMTFVRATHTFSWTPPAGTANHAYFVRFQVGTLSGGTDAIIAVILVQPSLSPNRASIMDGPLKIGPSPTSGHFALATPRIAEVNAELTIFDVTGRRLASLRGPSGEPLEWDGRTASGALVPPGVYLYRLEVLRQGRTGTFTVVR